MYEQEKNKCVQAIRAAFGDQLEIYISKNQDSEDFVSFRLNPSAKVVVYVNQDKFRVLLTAFYGTSEAEVVKSYGDIPEAIKRLYGELIGPSLEQDDSSQTAEHQGFTDSEIRTLTTDDINELNDILSRMKKERLDRRRADP